MVFRETCHDGHRAGGGRAIFFSAAAREKGVMHLPAGRNEDFLKERRVKPRAPRASSSPPYPSGDFRLRL
eukprot:13228752-Alexandrium_andersonii.AAC.1